MKRDRILEETRKALAKTGFFLSRPHGERGLCFDLVARRDDTLLLVKVFQNVDALSKETAHELKVIGQTLEGSPLVIGERSGTGPLEDGVIYSRFGVPILCRSTLLEFLEEGIPPFLFSAPGGLYVRLDTAALRRLRDERGLSLGALAEIAGVSRRTIQMYLEGMAATVDVAMRLEDVLSESLALPVDPFAFVADDDSARGSPPRLEGFERELY
ncbi:MAG: transcriptional regulator, partial [Thermoplasmata archaeon]